MPVKSVQSAAPVSTLTSISLLNIILLGLCVAGVAYYVSGANSLASAQYRVSSLRSQITRLNEQQSQLTAEKSAAENPVAATQFAQSQHMVSAQEIVYVFESGKVALQK